MKISNKLQKWVDQGLISQKQADKILLAEQSNNSNVVWKWMYGIAGLFIGLGFILLISANWDDIPAPLKLLGDFGIWAAILYGTYRSIINKKNKIKELFLILSFLFVGATIGLIGQIFNLSGGWHSFAMAWSLLGLPFVLFSKLQSFSFCWWCLLIGPFLWDLVDIWFDSFKKIFCPEEKCLYCSPCPECAFYCSREGIWHMATITGVLALSLISYLGDKLYRATKKIILLPKALKNLSMFSAYVLIFLSSFEYGFFRIYDIQYLIVIFAFLFFATRMFLAVRAQNMLSFKRNAIAVEVYIFLIFANRFGNLLLSGFGFIFGGIAVLGLIYLLRKTSKYIKTMEVFHE